MRGIKELVNSVKCDVDVRFAESINDKRLPGIHLFNPTKEEIIKALSDAMLKNIKTVIIHINRSNA